MPPENYALTEEIERLTTERDNWKKSCAIAKAKDAAWRTFAEEIYGRAQYVARGEDSEDQQALREIAAKCSVALTPRENAP